MVWGAIEILALILIIVSLIKFVVMLISPKSWFKFAKGMWKSKVLAAVICFILAVVVFYFLTLTLSVLQILAVTLFVALLMGVGLAGRVGDLMKMYDKQIKSGNLWKEHWFYALLWLILIVWGIVELAV